MMPMTQKEFNEMVEKAKADEMVLIRPITESAKLYGVSYKEMTRIRSKLRFIIGTGKSVEYLKKIDQKRHIARIEKNLKETNINHPGILKEIREGVKMSVIGRKYSITRQRVHQFKAQLNELIQIKGLAYVESNIIYTK